MANLYKTAIPVWRIHVSIAATCWVSTLPRPSGQPRSGTKRKGDPRADRRGARNRRFGAAVDFIAARNGCITKGESMLSTEAANGVG